MIFAVVQVADYVTGVHVTRVDQVLQKVVKVGGGLRQEVCVDVTVVEQILQRLIVRVTTG